MCYTHTHLMNTHAHCARSHSSLSVSESLQGESILPSFFGSFTESMLEINCTLAKVK